MSRTVDIYTTNNLYVRFCGVNCWYVNECEPVAYLEGVPSGYDLRVIGRMVCEECPIMARVLGDPQWITTENHAGRCGYPQVGD